MANKGKHLIENDYTPVTYDPQYILMVNHLKKYFPIKGGLLSQTVGHVKAVDGVTFNLRRGCTMGLVGESGCGKSTTGRTILRLGGEKTGGQVLFNGKEVYDMTPAEMRELRTKMQIIFQDPFSSLDPRWRVAKSVAEPLSLQRRDLNNTDIDERVAAALTMAGLEPADFLNRYPIDLSGGQAARVALARTLLTDPKVLLADEVDAGLDDDNAAKVATIMADAAAHGMAIIRIRHRPPDGRATRTLTLDKGRLTEREMTDSAAQDANAVPDGADENEETQA